MITVPSGEIDVKISFSCVPKMPESLGIDNLVSIVLDVAECGSKDLTSRLQRKYVEPITLSLNHLLQQ